MTSRWTVEERHGRAADLHAASDPPTGRAVRICFVAAPALVLGSTQRDEVVDSDAIRAAGIDVVRRRTGGGAVLVEPDAQVWLDVWVPADDPLWHPDVAVSFGWLGAAWRRALASFGLDATVHEGALACGSWGRLVCFAGRGPGEVALDGRKVVGLSQHRGRAGARFQASALLRWEPERLVELLAFAPSERAAAALELDGVAAALPVEAEALVAAVLAELP